MEIKSFEYTRVSKDEEKPEPKVKPKVREEESDINCDALLPSSKSQIHLLVLINIFDIIFVIFDGLLIYDFDIKCQNGYMTYARLLFYILIMNILLRICLYFIITKNLGKCYNLFGGFFTLIINLSMTALWFEGFIYILGDLYIPLCGDIYGLIVAYMFLLSIEIGCLFIEPMFSTLHTWCVKSDEQCYENSNEICDFLSSQKNQI